MKPTHMVWFAWDPQNAAHVEPHERRQEEQYKTRFCAGHNDIVFNLK